MRGSKRRAEIEKNKKKERGTGGTRGRENAE